MCASPPSSSASAATRRRGGQGSVRQLERRMTVEPRTLGRGIYRLQLLVGELRIVDGTEAILELVEGADADQCRGDLLASQHPGEGELRHRLVPGLRDLAKRIDRREHRGCEPA